MNKLRIVSDGTLVGASVLDSEGKPIDGVTRINIEMDANDRSQGMVKIELEVYASIDVVGEASRLSLIQKP